MSPPDSLPKVPAESARADLGGSGIGCPACGTPLQGRQTACSGKCRATLSRRRRDIALGGRHQELEAKLTVVRRDLREARAVLEAIGWLAKVTLTRIQQNH